jgi:hypothetical protein
MLPPAATNNQNPHVKKPKPTKVFWFFFSKKNRPSFFEKEAKRKFSQRLRRLGPEAPDPHFLVSIHCNGVQFAIGWRSIFKRALFSAAD